MSIKRSKRIYASHYSDYEIPFFDVDSMDIMWHGHYVKYLEMARCAFLEEIHYTYDVMRTNGFVWPIVQLNVKYVKPAYFRQKIRVHLMVVEYETCLRIEYIIEDRNTGQKLTQASTTQVAVGIETRETQFQTPDSWRDALMQYSTFNAGDL